MHSTQTARLIRFTFTGYNRQSSYYWTNVKTVTCCFRTGTHFEKCVVRRFRHCANVAECTYTNLETWHWLGLLMDESPGRHPVSRIGRFHPYWRFLKNVFSATQCSLLRLIVRSGLDFPTFAIRRLHAGHHARAPSGGRWNCGREMSGNFA